MEAEQPPEPHSASEYIDFSHQDDQIITSQGMKFHPSNSDFYIPVTIFLTIAIIVKINNLRHQNYNFGLTDEHRSTIFSRREASRVDHDIVRFEYTKSTIPIEDCPICYEEYTLPVETNCCHIYCASCIILAWETTESRGGGQSRLAMLKCPYCRADVSIFAKRYEIFDGVNKQSPEYKYISATQNKISEYNQRFSNSRRNLIHYIKDIPLMLTHLWREATGQNGVLLFCRIQVIFAVLAGIIYLCMPYDIIPERIFGVVGMADDVIVCVSVLVYLSFFYRNIVLDEDPQ